MIEDIGYDQEYGLGLNIYGLGSRIWAMIQDMGFA